MKYRILGFLLCIGIVLGTAMVEMMPSGQVFRYQQHEKARHYTACAVHTAEEDVLCTHLPIVEIDTNGLPIPGKAVIGEDGSWGFTTTADGMSEIEGNITVIDNGTKNNHLSDGAALESRMRIHVRGNSSRAFDKSGYEIRLMESDGTSNDVEMMGMDAHHEWVLHGPFIDKSLLRNYMWYNIAGQIMEYAPNVRFCEVLVNGEYNGVYVMMESITAGEGEGRLALSINKKDSTYSGYLLRLDRGSNAPFKNIETFTKYTYRTQNQLNIVYPGTANLTDSIKRSITDDFSAFEKSLYSFDYSSDKYGYKTMIDVQSFVDYFIINEFTCNYDAGWLSTYLYKDTDNKLKTCVWDMNSSCNNYEDYIEPDHFEFQTCLWYFMLMKDEDFTNAIIRRYKALRKTCLNEEYLTSYIDAVVDYLGPAIDRNYEKWGYIFERDTYSPDNPDHNTTSYESSIAQLKRFIAVRGHWLDENIETLKQYSAGSRNKKFNEVTD